MYPDKNFKDSNRESVFAFINRYPLALVTACTAHDAPVATHIPMLLVERDGATFLQGHIMRRTDHYKAFVKKPNALAVVNGPNAYVSARWYSNPQMGSTWNYMAVHVQGSLTMLSDEGLKDFMQRFTAHFEADYPDAPTRYEHLPKPYLEAMMPAIAGIEIKIDRVDHVFKPSQNRDEPSYLNIIKELHNVGGMSHLVAVEMEQRMAQVFSQDANKY